LSASKVALLEADLESFKTTINSKKTALSTKEGAEIELLRDQFLVDLEKLDQKI